MPRATSGSASPIISDGMPPANSTASMPRRTSARASAIVLPFSRATESREFFASPLECVGEPEHQPRAFDDRNARPGVERLARAGDGAIDLGGAALAEPFR